MSLWPLIQAGDEVRYRRACGDLVWCEVKAVYKDGSMYVVSQSSFDAFLLAEEKIDAWVMSDRNYSNRAAQRKQEPRA